MSDDSGIDAVQRRLYEKKNDVHKTTTPCDKKLQSTLKRLTKISVPSIEQVCIFKDDETIIQILNPKVEASIGAIMWVVNGSPQTKSLKDILPGIINLLGPDDVEKLKRLAEQFQKQAPGGAGEGVDATSAQEDGDEVAGETLKDAAAEEG